MHQRLDAQLGVWRHHRPLLAPAAMQRAERFVGKQTFQIRVRRFRSTESLDNLCRHYKALIGSLSITQAASSNVAAATEWLDPAQ